MGVEIVEAPSYYTRDYQWYIDGTVSTGTAQGPRHPLTEDGVAEDVILHVDTSPTGQSLIVDINYNGTTIFSTRPEIDAGGSDEDDNHVFSVTSFSAGGYLTCDVDQVGSGAAGADLTVTLKVRAKARQS